MTLTAWTLSEGRVSNCYRPIKAHTVGGATDKFWGAACCLDDTRGIYAGGCP